MTAFNLLREGLLASLYERKSSPRLNVYSDQIVWGVAPLHRYGRRMDGPPPYSLLPVGVVNIAIELNGQPPLLQVYIKPCAGITVVLRSIDTRAMEVVRILLRKCNPIA